MLRPDTVHPDTFDHFDLHGMKHLARCSQAWECSGVLLQSRSGAFRDLISWLQKHSMKKKTGLVSNSKNGNLRNFTTFFSCFRPFFYVFLLLPPPIRPWKPIIPTVLGRTSPHGSVPQCPWPRRRVPPCERLPRCCRPSNASGQCGRRDGGDAGRWAQPGLLVNDGNTNLFLRNLQQDPLYGPLNVSI